MALFAEIGPGDTVIRVLVIPDEEAYRGSEFLSVDLGLGGEWVETRQDKSIRNEYAGPGSLYLRSKDAFLLPKKYPSWIIDEEKLMWTAPVPYPKAPGEWKWDEHNQQWVRVKA